MWHLSSCVALTAKGNWNLIKTYYCVNSASPVLIFEHRSASDIVFSPTKLYTVVEKKPAYYPLIDLLIFNNIPIHFTYLLPFPSVPQALYVQNVHHSILHSNQTKWRRLLRRRSDAALLPLALSAGNHTDIKVAILLITFLLHIWRLSRPIRGSDCGVEWRKVKAKRRSWSHWQIWCTGTNFSVKIYGEEQNSNILL